MMIYRYDVCPMICVYDIIYVYVYTLYDMICVRYNDIMIVYKVICVCMMTSVPYVMICCFRNTCIRCCKVLTSFMPVRLSIEI